MRRDTDAKASGTGLMDCSMHFHGVAKPNQTANQKDAAGERAWAHVKPDVSDPVVACDFMVRL